MSTAGVTSKQLIRGLPHLVQLHNSTVFCLCRFFPGQSSPACSSSWYARRTPAWRNFQAVGSTPGPGHLPRLSQHNRECAPLLQTIQGIITHGMQEWFSPAPLWKSICGKRMETAQPCLVQILSYHTEQFCVFEQVMQRRKASLSSFEKLMKGLGFGLWLFAPNLFCLCCGLCLLWFKY